MRAFSFSSALARSTPAVSPWASKAAEVGAHWCESAAARALSVAKAVMIRTSGPWRMDRTRVGPDEWSFAYNNSRAGSIARRGGRENTDAPLPSSLHRA